MNVITGTFPMLPGASEATDLLTRQPTGERVDPAAVLGRKGLRYKDRATTLGLAAALLTLRDAELLGEDGRADPATAVVVSSNLGNLDTVCRVARTIADETTRGVSPMDTANASSNVIASEIAIRFGLRGPNLTLCNGPTSGVDAVRWASLLLRAERADRVLVLGVEPDNETVRAFTGKRRCLDGAAAMVLESAEAARERGARTRAELVSCVRSSGVSECLELLSGNVRTRPGMWLVPETDGESLPERLLTGVARTDLSATWGAASGALGVLQCVAAVGWFDSGEHGSVHAVAGSDADDASAGVVLESAKEYR
ncbi:3-oxoacyl-[acyl-carrier-protein] synthase II [Actinopolyspora alba]|uniref:3-oxoacyl-[acyl-carrier-protein] synthase II n=1 Tax=Actinopolyspora alba TaxID=673379 RepID=A0A1I1TP99_9ACTN|nr:beta-ketoacyl synthase N-terminal-like domain-containing protein [Actinopolyspora alba]SFD60546.1 3-oxoacyl-[acyl-carrier-protein] synthase II [Actinopolyspora alba]